MRSVVKCTLGITNIRHLTSKWEKSFVSWNQNQMEMGLGTCKVKGLLR